MARCDICNKGPIYGNRVSHAHNLTRRRWNPNLQRVRVLLAEQSAPPFDDLFLELAGRNQPPLRPQAVGEVEHGGKRLGVVLPERPALPGY